jgi:hypothetical protein
MVTLIQVNNIAATKKGSFGSLLVHQKEAPEEACGNIDYPISTREHAQLCVRHAGRQPYAFAIAHVPVPPSGSAMVPAHAKSGKGRTTPIVVIARITASVVRTRHAIPCSGEI